MTWLTCPIPDGVVSRNCPKRLAEIARRAGAGDLKLSPPPVQQVVVKHDVYQIKPDGAVVQHFASSLQAGRAMGVRASAIRRAARDGYMVCGCYWSRDGKLPPCRRRSLRRPVEINGVKYPTIGAAADATGTKWTTMWRRVGPRTVTV